MFRQFGKNLKKKDYLKNKKKIKRSIKNIEQLIRDEKHRLVYKFYHMCAKSLLEDLENSWRQQKNN